MYAHWLTARGHRVRLVDPVPLHVESAAREGIDAVTGDAPALSEPDSAWDAVLLLGPLYHLPDRADRVRALAEARRVVRPGGVVLAAAISRWASLYEVLFTWPTDVPDFAGTMRADVATGVRRAAVDHPRMFTTAYFHRPEELPGEVADAGLRLADLYAVEGMAHWMPDLAARLADPAERALVLEVAALTEREPATLGATGHILVAARR